MNYGDNPAAAAAAAAPSIGSVAIRPAEFSEAHAAGWFAILEAQFNLANVSSSRTKFFHALSALPAPVVSRLSPTIIAEADYTDLKEAVLVFVEKSKPELFNSLTATHKIMGRPSTFLQDLRNTADKVGVGDDFVRHRFLQSVPASISPVLTAQTTLNLDQLGVLADELTSMSLSNQHTWTTNDVNHISGDRYESSDTRGQYPGHRPTYHHQPRKDRYETNRSGDRARIGVLPYHEHQKPKVCRAHLYYGPAARTCRPWCTWPKKTNCKILSSSRNSSRETSPIATLPHHQESSN